MSNVWKSITELENRGGVLYFDGCDVRDLAAQYGTPLYIYSENRLRTNYRRLVNAYKKEYPKFKVYYAVKANNNPAIVLVLASEGAGADASCIAEVLIARMAGISDENILFSGVYQTDDSLRYAVQNNIRTNLEDLSQLDRMAKFGLPKFLSFRVNPGVCGTGREGVIFSGPDAKFGINERDIEKAYAKAKDLGVERFGIHMMTGSNILTHHYFEQAVERLMDIAGPMAQKLGITFDFIDIGGSLGVPYRPEEEELDISKVAKSVVKMLRQKLAQYKMGEPLLLHEPGRYLVCDAGILLASVTSIKHSDKTFIGLDAGMHTLVRPALYDAYHHILYANDLHAPCDQNVNVVGQLCLNTDTFAKDRALPSKIVIGDLLAIMNAGAYGFAMSSQFNTQTKAAEILVRDGMADVIRERETFDNLIQGTRIPEHLHDYAQS